MRHPPRLAGALLAGILAVIPFASAHAATATATPTGLAATARSARYVALAWHRSTGDDGSYYYRLFRDGVPIGARQKTVSYLDRPALGRHLYQVRAFDSAGNASSLTPAVAVWSVSRLAGSVAPAKPTSLTGVTGARGQAHLSWHAGSGGTSTTHSYRIYRNGMAVGFVPYTSTTFDDYRAGLRAAAYEYTVQAVDLNGYTSAMTSSVSVTVHPGQYTWAGNVYFSGSSSTNAVALTFDDCYNGAVVARIANILRNNNAPGTFFCVGQAAQQNADVLAAVARDFPIGNHTWDHADLGYLDSAGVLSELTTATRKMEAATGRPMPPIMRPPYGHTTATVRSACDLLGFAIVRWNIETNDWRATQSSSEVLAAALEARPGNIIIMHDKAKTADVLAQIISGLRAKGLKLVTVPQLLAIPWQRAERDY